MVPVPDCKAAIRELRDHLEGRTGDELAAILEAFGFTRRERKSGSNSAFTHDDCESIVTVPLGGTALKKMYAQAALDALREICDD